MTVLSPKAIYEELNKTVVGQDAAKKTVATTLFLHFVKFFMNYDSEDKVKKSNMMLIGPSGNGKTHLIREGLKAIKKITGYELIPLIEIDGTALTPRGWDGEDLIELIQNGIKKYPPEIAKSAVIFIDEIDKLCNPAVGKGGSDHNKNTQYDLLKAVEGAPLVRSTSRGSTTIDTSEMLFIFAGNFPQIRHTRVAAAKSSIGFVDVNKGGDLDLDIATELEKSGMATQLVGRISYFAELTELTSAEFKQILERFVIPERNRIYDELGYELKVPRKVINRIIERTMKRKTGARALDSLVDEYIEKDLFKMEFDVESRVETEDEEE